MWQQPTWAEFTWNNGKLITLLSDVRNLEGRVLGLMSGLGFSVQNIRLRYVHLVLAYVFKSAWRAVVAVAYYHFLIHDECAHLASLAVAVFCPYACHA